MQKNEVLDKLCEMYTGIIAGWNKEEVSTLEEIRAEVEYLLSDYTHEPNAPDYKGKLLIDKDRIYADVLLRIITQHRPVSDPCHVSDTDTRLYIEMFTTLSTLNSVQIYRTWEDIASKVDKLEIG